MPGRLIALLVAACLALTARAQTPDLAFQRADHLRRGINTCCWFAQAPGNYSETRLQTFITEDDLRLIRQLGFDHIRLSVDADPLMDWERKGQAGTMFMTQLDRVVRVATGQGLAVIVDVHPESAYKRSLLQGNEPVQQFARLWRALATHFAGTDPNLVYFEIMNEPEQSDPYRWQGIQSLVAAQIRAAAPNHTVIATSARWSGLEDLLNSEPIGLSNVIYTFHDYEPFAFTHQGATWTEPAVEPLRRVPYPATPDAVQDNLRQEPTLAGQFFVEQYALSHWDAQRIDGTLAFAERWATMHHVPVYVGEFGAYRPFADEAARVRWLHDMRVAMEKHHLGWAMWEYNSSFGLVTTEGGKTTVDQEALQALGLKALGLDRH